ncbi:HipA domain-containing protein [Paludisphaera rhizosphaerae]|uniref:HipA domain-containing protein n=1 Tax=Paludisphaera rhizosphaerae TaxID=2711216 RepID=UPI0013EB19D8|nr:HipA domain-containing protein [Paludisphaera rhizosphaerae]
MTRCPGCLKADQATFCAPCRKRLFDGKKVPFELPFSRPDYDRAKREDVSGRMSISGVQTKIPLALRDGKLEMAAAGGQYILKPRPHGSFDRLDMVPINEHLTMQIARRVFKIAVAENALVSFSDGEVAYLVRRFDVQADGSRLLQEDFAQIASRSEETHGKNYKYDFSYEEIGRLIRRYVPTSKVDLERYFALVAFNYLVHNGDAHAKNFSLIRSNLTGAYALTPAYDLLNTRLHLPGESQTALDLFADGFETESYKANGFYAYDDFVEFARRLDLVETRSRRILEAFIAKRPDVFSLIDSSRLSDECKESYRKHVDDRTKAFSYSYSDSRR